MIRTRRSHLWILGLLLLTTVAMVALVGLQSTPLFDRDEPRYAQASKQMFESGDWVVPMLLDEPRLKKPIAIYWAQAGMMHLFGPTVQSARLPSAIALILTSAMLLIALRSLVGARRALWATFIFATSLLVLFAGKTTLTDSLLLLWITGAQLCLYSVWRGRYDLWILVAMGLCIGLALLTKGPVVLMFMGMTLVALFVLQIRRITPRAIEHGRWIAVSPEQALPRALIRIAVVFACAAVVLAPWIVLLERHIPGAILNMLSSEVVARGAEPQEGHTGPPGYYLLTLPATWFPWIVLLPATCVHAWRRRHRPMTRFAFAAVVGPWLFLEIYQTKLPHYLLGAFPFLSILTADMLVDAIRRRIHNLADYPFVLTCRILAVLIVFVFAAMLVVPAIVFSDLPVMFYLAGTVLLIAAAAMAFGASWHFARLRPGRAALILGLGSWAICTINWTLYFPNATFLHLSQRTASALQSASTDTTTRVAMVGYREGSLAFYQGGTIRPLRDANFLQTNPPSAWPDLLVCSRRWWDDQPYEVQDKLTILAEHRGLNLGDFRIHDVMVVRRRQFGD